MSEAARRLRPGHLLVDAPLAVKLALPLVLFLGLFLHELLIFAFAPVRLVFASLFVRRSRRLGDLTAMTLNGAYFMAPAVAILACVIFVAPPLTERFFDFGFDYLGNTLAVGANWHGAASFLEGPHASLTPAIMLDNFTTLSGMSLASWRTSPLVKSPFGDYPGSHENNLPKLAALVAFFGAALWLAWSLGGPLAWSIRGTLVALALFILFLSLLLIRHLPVATGSYYGPSFAVLFALLSVEAVYLVYELRTIDRRGVRMFTPASRPERSEWR